MRSPSLSVPLLAMLLLASSPAAADEAAYREALSKAEELRRRGDFGASIKTLQKAHKLAPGAFECCFELARTYSEIGQLDDAAESARAAVAAAPGPDERREALDALGLALFGRGDAGKAELEEAADAFRRIVELAPRGVARFNLGVTLLKLERDEEGVAVLEEFLAEGYTGTEARLAKTYVENPRRAREALVPDFEAVTLDGETVTPADFAGKVLLIDFWGTWCAPCVDSIPHLQRLAKWSEKSPFALLSVSNDDDGEMLREFVAKYEMDWPQVWDEDRQLTGEIFQIRAYPTFLVVDHQGIIRYRTSGWGERVERDLDAQVSGAIRLAKKAAKKAAKK